LRGTKRIVVAALVLTATLNETATAAVGLQIVPQEQVPRRGAQGLLVPGHGIDVTREDALEKLRPLLRRGEPGGVTIYVSLPPPGRHHNVVRYPIAIVGDGYRGGLLVDERTRLPGLVAIGSVASTVEALNEGRAPPITSRADPQRRTTLARLDERLDEAHDARSRANVALALLILLLVLPALWLRFAYLARAAVLAVPATLALGLELRSSVLLFLGGLVMALVLALPRRAFRPLLFAALAGALLVLWQWPETNALATIGPHPDGGGRFHGLTNQTSTLLLPTALLAGLWAAPLALFTVGWSKAGADGGGLLSYGAGYAMLALRGYGRLTLRRILVAAGGVAVLALLLVGIDAVTGGSSHVTRAVDTDLPGELAHRWRESARGPTRNWGAFALFASGVAVLLRLALVRPRPATLDAMLVAIAVSLVVNDTPQDIAFWGALGALSILAFERAR
jgi:hypothetical protein